jgi:TolB-like protein/Flp pilus assembly protein TadD
VISRTVHEAVTGRLKATFEDLGGLALKNIERPVQAFSVRWEPSDWQVPVKSEVAVTPVTARQTPLPLPDKPSIAVLPFQNISGDPEQEYFADGITEDITTALSRISSLFVIARNSSFAYKGRAIDIRQIGRELGVRYVLEGSVRRAGQRLRITGQLVEAETGAHLWADKFDSALEDVFDLQDRVTMAAAGAIEPSVTQAEIRRANRKTTANLQAYDWLLRALGEQQLYSRDGIDRAMHMARRAIELDPRYAQAYAYLASWILLRRIYGWMENETVETAEGIRLAHLAVQLEPNDPIVLTEAAFALGHLDRDLATALSWFDRAIALNPNSASTFGRGAVVRNFAGDYVTAAEHADRALRLSPFDNHIFTFTRARGDSHLYRRQAVEAVPWLRRAAQENPRHAPNFLHLGSALAHVGELEEARAAIQRLLELRPMSSATWQRQHRVFPENDHEYMLEGARLAGLPE